MQVTSSYGVEIKKQNLPVRHTLRIYRAAVEYLIRVYTECWDKLQQIDSAQKRFNAAEHLVHGTKKNRAVYDFDLQFPKMPSYEKICAALGVTLSQFFQEGNSENLTEKQKEVLGIWNNLSTNEQETVMSMLRGLRK